MPWVATQKVSTSKRSAQQCDGRAHVDASGGKSPWSSGSELPRPLICRCSRSRGPRLPIHLQCLYPVAVLFKAVRKRSLLAAHDERARCMVRVGGFRNLFHAVQEVTPQTHVLSRTCADCGAPTPRRALGLRSARNYR